LAARVPRQAIWKRVSPSGSGAAPGDNTVAATLIVVIGLIYKDLVISRRLACWCSLSCGSERIP